jgi:uncharacterized protein YqeY
MALLIVAVVAGLSIRFASDYQLGLARAEGRWHGVQARAYLQGAESLAAYLLGEDDPEVDGLHEPWAQPLPPFEVEGGWIMATIEDARARFNLNNLLSQFDQQKAHNDPTRFTTDQRRFLRLLQSFEQAPISEDQAIELLAREAKQRSEAAEAYEQGGRTELAEKERRELAVIQRYLPEQLGEDALRALIDETVEATGAAGPQDMGKVMGALMPKVKGRADGKHVSALVRERLG